MINYYFQKTILSETQVIFLVSTSNPFGNMKNLMFNNYFNFQVSRKMFE